MIGSSVISGPFRDKVVQYTFRQKICELYLADFPFKRYSFIASPSVLWFCGGATVKRFELIAFFLNDC